VKTYIICRVYEELVIIPITGMLFVFHMVMSTVPVNHVERDGMDTRPVRAKRASRWRRHATEESRIPVWGGRCYFLPRTIAM